MNKIIIIVLLLMISGCQSLDPYESYRAALKDANSKGIYPDVGVNALPVIVPTTPMVPLMYYNSTPYGGYYGY